MKKFLLSSDELKRGLKKVGQAVNEKTVLPILKNIYCKVGNNVLELITSDLEITMSYKCVAETGKEEPFELLLPYDYVQQIMSVTGSVPVVIEHPSARKAKIICDADEYEINVLEKVADFPKIPETPNEKTLELNSDFVKLLQNALITVSKDEARPAMQRVLFDIQKSEACVVSTDAQAIYKHQVDIAFGEAHQLHFTKKMASAIDGMKALNVSFDKNMVCLKTDNITLWCRRFDDRFPDYRVVIPTYGPNLSLNKYDFIQQLHKACINSNANKQTVMFLQREPGFIHFETEDADYGRKNYLKLAGTYSGKVDSISFSARKMLAILQQNDCEEIKLHIHDAKKAILLSTDSDENYLGLIMPIIIN